MKRLFNGREVPTQISTDVRIFQVFSFDGDILLCNLDLAVAMILSQECKAIKHYWNHKFVTIGKKEVLEIKS